MDQFLDTISIMTRSANTRRLAGERYFERFASLVLMKFAKSSISGTSAIYFTPSMAKSDTKLQKILFDHGIVEDGKALTRDIGFDGYIYDGKNIILVQVKFCSKKMTIDTVKSTNIAHEKAVDAFGKDIPLVIFTNLPTNMVSKRICGKESPARCQRCYIIFGREHILDNLPANIWEDPILSEITIHRNPFRNTNILHALDKYDHQSGKTLIVVTDISLYPLISLATDGGPHESLELLSSKNLHRLKDMTIYDRIITDTEVEINHRNFIRVTTGQKETMTV